MFALSLVLSLLFINNISCNETAAAARLVKQNFEEIQDFLETLTEDNAPQALKTLLEKRDDDNSHFCCKIDPPTISFQQTKLVSQNVVLSGTHTCGYTGCGLWGWSSCEVQCTNYWTVTEYHIEQYTVYQKSECPQAQITCCIDYFFVLGHCLHLNEIASNLDILQQLQQQGIVIPGLSG